MIFPLNVSIDFSLTTGLFLAAFIGVGFGYILEQAGFSSAKKIISVFYFYDMTVLKVMFSAVVTAMAGLFLLSWLNLLDLSQLYIESTNYYGAVLGGLIFGVGFVLGGYCPGTSVVAAATGKIDAWYFIVGFFIGTLFYSELLINLELWLQDKSLGEQTLVSLTNIAMGWWLLLFILILILAVFGIKKLENKFKDLNPDNQ